MLFRKKFLFLALIFITGSAGFIAFRNTGTTEHPVQIMSSGPGEPDNSLLTHRIIMTDQHSGRAFFLPGNCLRLSGLFTGDFRL
ncbi:UNVERIFIED_ORG: hypothetical protein FHU00_5124 [Citrobacter freundii]